jgi:glycosyltransferase involved in cell wall biosynthesis
VSADLQQSFVGRFGEVWQSRSVVRPSPIDVPPLDTAECRRALGIASGRPLALVVARLVSGKRVEVALAFREHLPEHDWVVIGDGPERARLARRFERVRFLGQLDRDATLRWICAADVLISASLSEGAPTVVREARALGTRVIAAAAGDLEQWAASDPGIQLDPRLTSA